MPKVVKLVLVRRCHETSMQAEFFHYVVSEVV
jgi:hypothetical protein